jgi:hypothetical protein
MKELFKAFTLIVIFSVGVFAQATGTAGSVSGVVTDPDNAVIPGATVTLSNALTGYTRTVTTDTDGSYRFNDVPPNNYNLKVVAVGFSAGVYSANVRSTVPLTIPVTLSVATTTTTVDISANATIVENIPTTHTDVDQSLIRRLPLSTSGNSLSDVITLTSPGVAADSNGFFHPLGDHAQAQFSIDGQPISDQQTKAFSTQLPANAIGSMEIITGAVPPEYGDKTSLVVNAVTRSGLNQKRPTGSFFSSIGKFGTYQQEANLAFGNSRYGNFVAFNYDRSHRFLDAPEFVALHDDGNAISVFDRFDFSPTSKDTFHFNLFAARNNFQIANTYDQAALGQDQRQRVTTFNIAPGYVHIFNSSTVLSINPFYRVDNVNFYPSSNPFDDQTATYNQHRRLANYGVRADVSYVHGVNNIKVGGQTTWTGLKEFFQFGITDPDFNDPANPDFLPGLLPFDLTRGGHLFTFTGNRTIKQQAAYIQDSLTFKNGFTAMIGVRFDNYNGIAKAKSVQPRLGVSYRISRTNTVLRASYTRNFETPYNESLILSNATGADGLGNGILGDASVATLKPGRRNQYNVGFQQGIGQYIVLDVDYFNKKTNNAYDFNVILNTPIYFPISWAQSKLDGVSFRVNLADYHGVSAFFSGGHNRARYFPPETGGLFFNSDLPAGVFRIDHDQAFQQTTYVRYSFDQMKSFHKFAPFVAFTWKYDSGLVAGAVTDYDTAMGLSADEQQQIGLFCGSVFATLTNPITTCSSPDRGALRLRIPADGTENDDLNPPRVSARHLFDLSFGGDNLTRSDKVKLSARITFVNLANKQALYNFDSTFSGTHFVTPRSIQAQFGLTF